MTKNKSPEKPSLDVETETVAVESDIDVTPEVEVDAAEEITQDDTEVEQETQELTVAAADGEIKVKNITGHFYYVDDIQIPAGESVILNLSLIRDETLAKIKHGIKEGIFTEE